MVSIDSTSQREAGINATDEYYPSRLVSIDSTSQREAGSYLSWL
ncbi:hypothetical protein CRC_03137 [Cylindrospermopsis raciborskii CS-505]|nr:hypothetical protein CRC_03137 [Cylindrospermopsis raciborskii CS-505]